MSPPRLVDVDVLLTSTGAATPLLEAEDIDAVVEARGGRPLLIVDIAMPRDIDPAVGGLPGVTLLDMDDLRAFADVGTKAREDEVAVVRALLDEELERYLGATSAREVAPMIVALRDRAEEVRQAEVERYRARLGALDDGPARHGRRAHAGHHRQAAPRSVGRARRMRPARSAATASSRRCASCSRSTTTTPLPPRPVPTLRAATRGSPLALWQTEHVASLLPRARSRARRRGRRGGHPG